MQPNQRQKNDRLTQQQQQQHDDYDTINKTPTTIMPPKMATHDVINPTTRRGMGEAAG